MELFQIIRSNEKTVPGCLNCNHYVLQIFFVLNSCWVKTVAKVCYKPQITILRHKSKNSTFVHVTLPSLVAFILLFIHLYYPISFHTVHYFNWFYMCDQCMATFTIYFQNIATLFQISTKQNSSTKPKFYQLSLLASHTTFSLLYRLFFTRLL